MNWNETKSKREVEQEDRARISNESVAKEQYTDNSERRDKRDSQYCDNIMQTRIAPHASVEPKNIEQEYFDTQKQGKQFCKLPQSSPVKQNGFETNCVSQEVREYDKKNINAQDKPEFWVPYQIPQEANMSQDAFKNHENSNRSQNSQLQNHLQT